MSSIPSKMIYIVAALIVNAHKELLLVRKKGTTAFMQAGGKIEAGETPFVALQRELQEELALTVSENQCVYVGHFVAPAANEKGYQVDAHVYQIHVEELHVSPHAELEEMIWCTVDQAKHYPLAPLTKDNLLPLVQS